MKFEQKFVEAVKNYRKIFKNITEADLLEGYEISKTVKEGERPEERLSEEELLKLSAYYEYDVKVRREKLIAEEGDDDEEE